MQTLEDRRKDRKLKKLGS